MFTEWLDIVQRPIVKIMSDLDTSVRDRNSGNYGFLDVINFTYCHTLKSQQGCLRLRELRHVTDGVIFLGRTKFHSMNEKRINSPRLMKDTI